MKKLLLILVCVPLIFNSCKKGDKSPDDNTNNTSGSILGIWRLQTTEWTRVIGYIDPVSGTNIETGSSEGIVTHNDTLTEYFVFRYDNTVTHYYYNYVDTLFVEVDKTYIKNGDELDLGVGEVSTITELTDSNLTLVFPSYRTFTLPNDSTTSFIKQITDYNYIKSNLPSITIQP